MNFSEPSKVTACIRAGENVEQVRSANRTKILNSANGIPPLSADDAEAMGIKINVNFLELLTILTRALRQLLSAFLGNQYFFTVKIPLAPVEYRSDWEQKITAAINRPLRKSLEYFELHRQRWATVITHGVGPMTWRHSDKWLPQFVAMNDLRIPTDTTTDFRNLTWYAQRVSYTPIELVNEVFNNRKNNHWDKRAVAKILENYKDLNFTDATNNYSWNTDFEKMAELMKQNGGFYGSDAVPTIPLFHFYFEDEDKDGNKKWYMRIVPDGPVVKGDTYNDDKFLWTCDEPIADSWKQLLHCQFGDLSIDAPFKYHSIRGLGYMLLEPTFYDNLAKCRMLQHVMDNFNVWLRNTDRSNKGRNIVQEFGNLTVVAEGVSVMPRDERHQIDAGLLELALAQMKQLQSEASASYTQESDTGTAKEQTAFETRVKMEQVNSMMGSILMTGFKYESYADEEICRRFCKVDSTDEDVKKFRKQMLRAGIPQDFLDVDLWDVEPVTPLGQGNPTIALSMAQQIMGIYDKLSPEAQRLALHEYVLVTTKDPAKAAQLVPLDQKDPSEASREAAGLFGSLMQGVPVPLWGTSLIDQIDQLMPMLAGKITLITQRNNMATQDEAAGLSTVASYIGQAIAQLAQDPQQKARVKQYTDSIGKLGNEIKGLVQRGQQAMKAQAQGAADGAAQAEVQHTQAKLAAMQVQAEAKARASDVKAAQQLEHKQMGFEQEQKRKDAETLNQIERDKLMAASKVQNDKTVADAKAAQKPATPVGA